MKPVVQRVASSFLYREGRYLLLHRTQRVKTYGGYWCSISGKSEPGERIGRTALREIEEETGITAPHLTLLNRGAPFVVTTEFWHRRISPFCFALDAGARIRLNYEHSAVRWISPWDLTRYRVVPRLRDTLLTGGLPEEALQAIAAVARRTPGEGAGLHSEILRLLQDLAGQWTALDSHELRRRVELTAWGMAGATADIPVPSQQIQGLAESCILDRINRLRK